MGEKTYYINDILRKCLKIYLGKIDQKLDISVRVYVRDELYDNLKFGTVIVEQL